MNEPTLSQISQKASQRLTAQRRALVLDHPFFGSLAVQLKPVEAPHITETAATDGTSLFYNADYILADDPNDPDTLTDAQLLGLVAHEVMHPALGHHVRRGNRDPEEWNEACDFAINGLLKKEGFQLPNGALYDPAFDGLSAERIFDLRRRTRADNEDKDESDGGSCGSGDNDSSDNTGGASPNNTPTGDQKPGRKTVAQMPGAVLDAADPIVASAQWQVALNQAVMIATAAGRLPGGIVSAASEAVRARTDWWNIMRRFVQERSASDYTFRTPNRRYVQQGVFLPALESQELGDVILFYDTSASTKWVRAEFEGHAKAIIEECRPRRTHVVYIDTQVARVDVFERDEPVTFNPTGEGGTDFRPAFQWVDDEQLQPACVIYLTDGEGDYPEYAPDYPVLWAMTTDYQAPWGEVVRIES